MQMASHRLRWALLTELARSDRRVRELAAIIGEKQNLVSYHLRLLRSAGLVDLRQSSFDGRDSYYHLNLTLCAAAFRDAATDLHPALAPAATPTGMARLSVLFLCTGNSARSPMAEAMLRRRGRIRVASAGSHPKPRFHPNAVRIMREEYNIDLSRRRPRPLPAVAGQRFDYVITLCDKVREVPLDRGRAVAIHWSIPEPASYPQFRSVASELNTRINFLMPVLAHHAEKG